MSDRLGIHGPRALRLCRDYVQYGTYSTIDQPPEREKREEKRNGVGMVFASLQEKVKDVDIINIVVYTLQPDFLASCEALV